MSRHNPTDVHLNEDSIVGGYIHRQGTVLGIDQLQRYLSIYHLVCRRLGGNLAGGP